MPSILIIYADDLGYGDLGCYGSQPSVAPHLADIGEQHNLAELHGDVVTRLEKRADAMRDELGDRLQKKSGKGSRPREELSTGGQ